MYRLTDTELEDALFTDRPSLYLWEHIERYPQLAALAGVTQPQKYHEEGDALIHTLMVTDEAAKCRGRAEEPLGLMLSAVCHDMGKAVCTKVTDGAVHSLGHETAGLPIVSDFLSLVGADDELCGYVLNMTKLHMEPNIMAAANSRLKKTNRLFYESVCPYDLILLSVCDGAGKIPQETHEDFLMKRYDKFREIMARPYLTEEDLLAAGITESRLGEGVEYAHKLRLAGIDRENALRQTLSQIKEGK